MLLFNDQTINWNLLILSSIKLLKILMMKSSYYSLILILMLINMIQATQLTINTNPPYSQSNLEDFRLFQNNEISNSNLHQASSESVNLSGSFNLNTSSSSIIESMPNFYTSPQASKFRVNVSNICEKNHMHVTIRLNRPFYGLIHTKDRRKKVPCFVEGNGDQAYTLDISYTLIQSDLSYCGVVSHHLSGSVLSNNLSSSKQQQQANNNHQTTLSVVLVVRLHKTIEFSDDRYFLLSCANRCSKPDCTQDNKNISTSSSPSSNRTSLQTPINSNLLLASETIFSPILRSAKDLIDQDKISNNSKLAWDGSVSTEKCDIMHLKLKWLLKVCFILSLLLALLICVAIYLCLTLNKRSSLKRDRTKLFNQKNQQINNKLAKSSSNTNNKKSSTSYAQSESLSWSTLTATTSDVELNKIREDNSYLAQQNQQLMLANLLANSNNNKNPLTATNPLTNNNTLNNGSTERMQHHRQPVATASMFNNLIVGRSIDHNLGGAQRVRSTHLNNNVRNDVTDDNNISFIKRRRSIGSSMGPIFPTDNHNNVQRYKACLAGQPPPRPNTLTNDVENNSKLDLSQRAKSRSQTTIYYEQNQDPFETVPFNFVNNGYLSDATATSQRVYLANNHSNEEENDGNNNFINMRIIQNDHATSDNGQLLLNHHQDYLVYPQQNQSQLDESMSHSLPPENIKTNLHNGSSRYDNISNQLQHHSKRWPNSKQAYILSPNNQMHISSRQKPQQVSSQFDPQQNSHQLIDLIQQKHKQQMEQANITAATLAPSSNEQLFNHQHQHHQQRSGESHNHHHKAVRK